MAVLMQRNAVLRHDGRAFALAHHHPSGNLDPSAADVAATTAVRAATTVGLRFLSHVVVSGNGRREISCLGSAGRRPT